MLHETKLDLQEIKMSALGTICGGGIPPSFCKEIQAERIWYAWLWQSQKEMTHIISFLIICEAKTLVLSWKN